jgi:hypothetical protein
MTTDPNLFLVATLMIAEHGPGAARRAAERVDRLQQQGDAQEAAVWVHILEAIEELSRAPEEGDQLH